MNYARAIAFCTAVAITGTIVIAASPAMGRQPIVVSAPAPEDVITRHVSYADLNLAAATGQLALHRRVGSAITSLCREALSGYDTSLAVAVGTRRCTDATWSDARPQIDRAVLRAQQLASTGATSITAAALTISVPR
jgi:UrcA family protein